MPSHIRQAIAGIRLFEGLKPDLLEIIANSITRKTLGKGEFIYQTGDAAEALFGVLSGRVILEVNTEDGRELLLNIAEPGDVFGEIGLLDFGPRREAARAAENTEIIRLERKRLLNLLQSSPELSFRVLSLLSSQLRKSAESLEDTTLYKLHNRLAKQLVRMAGGLQPSGAIVRTSQSELAGMLGVNRQAVNRHLRELEEDGLVRLGRGQIEISDPEALSELAAPGVLSQHEPWQIPDLAVPEYPSAGSEQPHQESPGEEECRTVGLLAVDAAEYSHALMADVAGTLKSIRVGFESVDRAIEQYGGTTIWYTGDRVLAQFPDAARAMQAALQIQDQVAPPGASTNKPRDSLFRIGVHRGEIRMNRKRFLGNAVNTVIRLTELSAAGGIAISAAVRDAIESPQELELRYLGEHELKNVIGTVPVYSARSMPVFRLLALRAETLVPRRLRPALMAGLLLVLGVGIWLAGDRLGPGHRAISVPGLSVAVLPFANEGDAALEPWANGIPEEIRAGLSIIPGMQVRGPESSLYFRGNPDMNEDAGRILEVAWLLGGSLENTPAGIRATAWLQDAATGEVTWRRELQQPPDQLLEFGSQVVRDTAVSMGIVEDGQQGLPQWVPLTRNQEAYALYAEAQSHLWRGRQRNTLEAIPLLQAAVELDPAFAEAHARLASLYLQTPLLDRDEDYNPQRRAELASQSLQRALALAPHSPSVLAAAAYARMHHNDLEGARDLADMALRIDPNNTDAWLTHYMVSLRQEDLPGMLEAAEKELRLEPISLGAVSRACGLLLAAQRYDEVLEIADRAMALYPAADTGNIAGWAAWASLSLGDRLGAVELYRRSLHFGPPLDLWTGLDHDWDRQDSFDRLRPVMALVYVEDYARVREVLDEVLGADGQYATPRFSLNYQVSLGELETLAGNHALAVEHFEEAERIANEIGVRMVAESSLLSWARQSHASLAMLKAYREAGRHDRADDLARDIESLFVEQFERHASVGASTEEAGLYEQAQFHAIENRSAEAVAKLRAWRSKGTQLFTYIKWDPFLDNLRGNPEFEAIVAEVEAELAEIRAQYHVREAELAAVKNG